MRVDQYTDLPKEIFLQGRWESRDIGTRGAIVFLRVYPQSAGTEPFLDSR